ncbi:uncharacterized protein LOC135848878 [Planococcus citri]|uniref:uncharacterized protein LOC135848878 n=1 Tax=Planococcus citri TaxID=170843 RepID=UPI0031F9D55A
MNSLKIVLVCFSMGCFVLEAEAISKMDALVYNPITQQLEEPKQSHSKCTICLLGCPAHTSEQQKINEGASVTGNGVFAKSSHSELESNADGEVYTKICDETYMPVMVQDTSTSVESYSYYQTGYELYYQDNNLFTLQCDKYNQFKKVLFTKADSIPGQGVSTQSVITINEKYNTKFKVRVDHGNDEIWTFFWISVLSIEISGPQRQINFTKDLLNNYHNLDETMPTCADYNLEDDQVTLPPLQWHKHQELLAGLDGETNPESSAERADQPLEIDFVDVQIMPMRYFHTFSARRATCTFLNVAHIWNTVIEQYNVVDSYLYAIYRKEPSQTNIIFGTKGLSQDVTRDQFFRINPQDNIITRKFPIPVPILLYRILEYKQDGQIFNAIFVIHNLLYTVPVDERICSKESEVEGWDEIKHQAKDRDIRPELIYVCPVTPLTIEKLQARYEILDTMQTFKLNSFPRFLDPKRKQMG